MPELADCENYDKLAENTFMPQAYGRLQQVLNKLKSGQPVTDDEKAIILKDFTEMSKVREQPYKKAYFDMAEEYFERLSPGYRAPVTYYPKISCPEFQAKLDEVRELDKSRVAQMLALKRSDGVVTDSARHNELNRQRLAALWDWKFYTDGAKAAGCEINMK